MLLIILIYLEINERIVTTLKFWEPLQIWNYKH